MNRSNGKASSSLNKLDHESFKSQSLEPEGMRERQRHGKKRASQVAKSVRTLTNNHIHTRAQPMKTTYHDETVRRLADYDFEYIFYRENQMKFLDLGIDAINKLHTEERSWLGQEVNRIGISFVVEKLAAAFSKETGPGVDQYDLNKLTWAEMFIKQPGIQSVMSNFLSEIKRVLDREMIENRQQLVNYIKFPRFSALKAQSKHKDKQAIAGQVYSIGQEVARTIITIKQERNKAMDRRLSYVDKLRSRGDGGADSNQDDLDIDAPCGKKTMHDFFEKLPPIIKKRNNALISKIQDYITREQSARQKFESIINSHKLFGEQMQQMVILKNMYDQEEKRRQEVQKYTAAMDKVLKTIDNIESDNRQFDNEILRLEDHSNLERIRRKKPTTKLMKELESWAQELEEVHMDRVQEYAMKHEYWETAESFEEILLRDTKGWELQRNAMTTFWVNRERKLKERYLFKIEAMEAAMQEIKLKCAKDLNRMEMQLADYESQQTNLNILNRYDTIEEYIHEQQTFIKQLGIANIQDFKSPFQLESDKHIKSYKAQEKKRRVLSRLGTSVVYLEDDEDPKDLAGKPQPSKSAPAPRSQAPKVKSKKKVAEPQVPSMIKMEPRPTQAGTGGRHQGTVSVELRHLSILYSKVNTYFKVMMNLHHQMDRANHHIGYKESQIMEAEQAKNQMHRKCVKYQDLVHGLFRIAKELLTETRIISNNEVFQLNLLHQLDDLKLTMDTSKIDGLINTLQNFHFDKKIENYRNIQNQIYEANVKLTQIFKELETSKWYLSDQNLIYVEESHNRSSTLLAQKGRSSTNIWSKMGTTAKDKAANYSGEKKQIMQLLSKSQQTHSKIQELMDINYSDILNIQTTPGPNPNEVQTASQVSLQREVSEGGKRKSVRKLPSQSQEPRGRRQEASLIKGRSSRLSKKSLRSSDVVPSGAIAQNNRPANLSGVRQETLAQNPGLQPFVTRMTFFGDTSDEVLKFTTKKRIYYIYDQINNTSLPSSQVEQFEKAIVENPIGCKLLQSNIDELSGSSYRFSSSDSSSSFDNEEKTSFEGMIKSINEQLLRMYTINTLERCKENITGNRKRKVDQLIQTVDILKMEGYTCPQINMVPLKLLLLKKKATTAKNLMLEALKIISMLFPKNDFTKSNKTYLKGMNQKDQNMQTDYVAMESEFQIFQKTFQKFIKKQTTKLQQDANEDKIYIDEVTKQMKLWKDVEKSFSETKDDQSFLKKLNECVMEQVNNSYDNGKFVTQLEFEQRVQELEDTIAELAEVHEKQASQFEQVKSSTGPLSGKHANLPPNRKSVFSAKSSKTLAHLKRIRTARASASGQTLQDIKDMKISDGNDIGDILIENYDKLGSIHDKSSKSKMPEQCIILPRQEEVVTKGLINVTQDILEQMDAKLGVEVDVSGQTRKSRLAEYHQTVNDNNISMRVEEFEQQRKNEYQLQRMLDNHGVLNPISSTSLGVNVRSSMAHQLENPIAYNGRRTRNAFTQVPRQFELDLKEYRESGSQSEVKMTDLNIILGFKQRAVNKIQQLEQIVKDQKIELSKMTNKLKKLVKEQAAQAEAQANESNQEIVNKGMRLLADINDGGKRPMLVNKMVLVQRSGSPERSSLPNELPRVEEKPRPTTELQERQKNVPIQLRNLSQSGNSKYSPGDTINLDAALDQNSTIKIQLDQHQIPQYQHLNSTQRSGFNTVKHQESKTRGDIHSAYLNASTNKDTLKDPLASAQLESQESGIKQLNQIKVNKPSPKNMSQESVDNNFGYLETSHLLEARKSVQRDAKLRTAAANSRSSLRYTPGMVIEKEQDANDQSQLQQSSPNVTYKRPKSSIQGHTGLFGRRRYFEQPGKLKLENSLQRSIQYQSTKNSIIQQKRPNQKMLAKKQSQSTLQIERSAERTSDALSKSLNTLDQHVQKTRNTDCNLRAFTSNSNTFSRNQIKRNFKTNIDEGPSFGDESFFLNRASKAELQKRVLQEFEMYKSSLQTLAQKKSQPVFRQRNLDIRYTSQTQPIGSKSPQTTNMTTGGRATTKGNILFQSVPAEAKERPMTTAEKEKYNFRTRVAQKNRLQTATHQSRKNQMS